MTEPDIRPATPADAGGIAVLLGHLGYPASAGAIPARLERLRVDGLAEALVASDGAALVALATVHARHVLHHDGPVVQLTALVVSPAQRGRGVGRALVERAVEWARARGADRLVVTTALHRADAPRFYEALGFEHTGRRYVRKLAQSSDASQEASSPG